MNLSWLKNHIEPQETDITLKTTKLSKELLNKTLKVNGKVVNKQHQHPLTSRDFQTLLVSKPKYFGNFD